MTVGTVTSRVEHDDGVNVGGRPPVSLLGGLATCGLCGTPMVGTTGASGQIYRCNRYLGGCGRVTRKRSIVDEYVATELLRSVDVTQLGNEAAALHEVLASDAQRVTAFEDDIADLRDRFAKREVLSEDYYATLDALRRELREVQLRFDRTREFLVQLSRDGAAREQWDSWPIEQRRAFVRSRTKAVIINRPKKTGRAAMVAQPGDVVIIPRGDGKAHGGGTQSNSDGD